MRPSVIRKINWLDQARLSARLLRDNPRPEAYWPKCNRCDVDVGMFAYEDRSRKGTSFEFRARCDHPEHQGSREDVVRADFDWPIPNEDSDPDFERAKRSCIFFPKANDV